MPSSPASLVSILWFVGIVVEIYLVYLVVKSRADWKVFLIYIASHLTWSLSMYGIGLLHRPWLFFWTYWWCRGIVFLLECAAVGIILAKILRPIKALPGYLTVAGVIATSTICAIGWYISGTVISHRRRPITRFVLSAELGLTTAEAIAILCFICFASLLARRWRWTDAWVTSGFVFLALATMLSSCLFSVLPHRYIDLIQIGVQVTDLLTFGLWIAAFHPHLTNILPRRVGILSRTA